MCLTGSKGCVLKLGQELYSHNTHDPAHVRYAVMAAKDTLNGENGVSYNNHHHMHHNTTSYTKQFKICTHYHVREPKRGLLVYPTICT